MELGAEAGAVHEEVNALVLKFLGAALDAWDPERREAARIARGAELAEQLQRSDLATERAARGQAARRERLGEHQD